MIINFTVGNYKSFKDKKTISFEATSIRENKEYIEERGKYKLLPTLAIYGANSSGKSNLINAIERFLSIIKDSPKNNSTDKLHIKPFLLNPRTEHEPSFFEIELIVQDAVYRYGFTANNEKIYEEWLYESTLKKTIEKCLFVRDENGIGYTENFMEAEGLESKTKHNSLFLSVVDAFNGSKSKSILTALNKIASISGLNHEYLSSFNRKVYADPETKKAMDNYLKSFDLGFSQIEIPEEEWVADQVKAYTHHNIYNDEGINTGVRNFEMANDESSGTNKLYDLFMLFIIGKAAGYCIIVDELDAKLHPLLTRKLIEACNKQSGQGGQLLFTTHDTNLLNINTFRRDQIWFTEKDNTEATDLYSLVEFKEANGKKIRNDSSLQKDYINGRYGAIPYIK